MDDPDLKQRYGSSNVAMKVMGALIALALVVLGGIWTFAGSGNQQSFGPAIAGVGVALGYVVLIQKRH